MNRLKALLLREFWENKGAFRTTPLVIGGIYIVFLLMAIFTTSHVDNDLYTFKEAVQIIAARPAEFRGMVMYQAMLGSSVFFTAVMSFVIFFYLLGSLYDDRKDRSILFWKSLPASDALTMASKLLSAMVRHPCLLPGHHDHHAHTYGNHRLLDGIGRRWESLDPIPQRGKPGEGLGHDRGLLCCQFNLGAAALWLAYAGLGFRPARTPAVCNAATAGVCGTADLDRIPAHFYFEKQCGGINQRMAVQ